MQKIFERRNEQWESPGNLFKCHFFSLLIKRRVLLKRINKFREKCQKLGNKQMSFNMRMNKYIIIQKPQCNISLQSLAAILKSKNQ